MQDNENNKCIKNLIDLFGVKQIIKMFDLMPDILFWIKDVNGGIVYGNKFFLEHIGVQNLNKAIGCTDFDFSPYHIAKQFTVDDQKVLKGESVHNRLELNITPSGETGWFTTSKCPLFDDENRTIGSYGISRHLEKTSLALAGMDALKVPVEYIRTHYMDEIPLAELAEVSCLSISALERRFKKHLDKTPKQFINEIRLENARRLLVETNLPIATIANDVGFSDPSYFSKQFNQLFGQRPSMSRCAHADSYTHDTSRYEFQDD
ncbi:MAG: AraC family transcriptional regulator [Colwellia sp.]|nr:AraC family transcriptional regulator [Colwellia sp.]